MARAVAYAVAAVAVAFIFGTVVAQAQATNTKDVRRSGYTFVSDVIGYFNITKDSCEIKDAIAKKDMATALKIYTTGKNSRRGAVFRNYATWATANHTGEYVYDALIAYHKNGSWLDAAIKDAFAKNNGALALGLITDAVTSKYLLHELDAAYAKVQKNETSLDEGAPHNIDEAYGIWANVASTPCGLSFEEKATRLAAELGTAYWGMSPMNTIVAWKYGDMIHNAVRNDSKAFQSDVQTMYSLTVAYHLQHIMRESYAAAVAGACRNAAAADNAKATAMAHFHIAAPLLEKVGASTAALRQEIAAATVSYAKASAAIQALATAYKLPAGALGTPQDAAIRRAIGLAACTARV